MAVKYTNISIPKPSKNNQSGIFGIQIPIPSGHHVLLCKLTSTCNALFVPHKHIEKKGIGPIHNTKTLAGHRFANRKGEKNFLAHNR
jgi:hypothetical protein